MVAVSLKKKSGRTDAPTSIFSSDETADAAKIVASANEDLTKIKVLYKDNEDKREDLKKAMETDNAEQVKKIADQVVYLINDGFDSAQSAIDKIEKAQEMQVNDDYPRSLAAYQLTDVLLVNPIRDGMNLVAKEGPLLSERGCALVKEDFKTRVENYRKLMEQARDYSNQANELAKDALRKQQGQ